MDRVLLNEALGELVRLRSATDRRARFYVAALQEWAGLLRMDPFKLNKLVLIKEAISRRRSH